MMLEEINAHMWQDIAVMIGLMAGLAGWMVYVIRRWSWIPRREQRTRFNERF